MTFTLQGFNTVKRDGVVLDANFTAPVNAEMRVGAIEETVTVTGESPIVDVQNTARREVVDRELLDALPTGRDFQTIGNVIPGVTMGRFDVGGSSTAQSGTLVAVRQPRRRLPAQDRRHARQQQLWRRLVQRHLPQRSDLPGDVLHRVGRECRESGGRCVREHDSADRRQHVRVRVPRDVLQQQSPGRRTSTTSCAPGDSIRPQAGWITCGTSTATRAGRSSATSCGSSGRAATGASPRTCRTSTGGSPIQGDPTRRRAGIR